MTYGETFQDKTVIDNYLVSNISFLTEFREYLKERAQLEKTYAKDSASLIQKYSQKFEKKRVQSICATPNTPNPLFSSPSTADTSLGAVTETSDACPQTPISPPTDFNKDSYTYVTAWRSIINQMKSINEARNKFSQKLTDCVIDRIKTQLSIKDDERKNHLQNLKNINNELEKLAIDKNNAKKKYYESCDSMVNQKKKLNKQDSSLNDNDKANDKGLKKIEKNIESTQVEMDNKKNLYILSLHGLNTLKKKVNNEYIPEIFNSLQSCQESIIGAFQLYCLDYVKLEQDLSEDIKNSFNNALIDINAINPVADNVHFEKENKKDIVPLEEEKFNGVLTDDNGDFTITNKSSIYLSNVNDNIKNQLTTDREKYNSIKTEYDQLQTAYQSYMNDPSNIDCREMMENQTKLWNNVHMAEIPIIVNEAKVEAITQAIGDDTQVNSHNFKSVMLLNTVCDFCQEKLRGKALQCKSCSFVSHVKCVSEVPDRCTGIKMDRKALRIRNDTSSLSSPTHTRALSVNSTSSADSTEVNHAPSLSTNPSPLGIITNSSPEESSPIIKDEQESPIFNPEEEGLPISNPEEQNSPISNTPEVPPKDEEQASPTSLSPSSPFMCAIFEYQPQNGDEVALSINDKVEIIEPEADGWVKVKTDHGEGFVPSNYIAPIKKAIYDFEPDKDDEIPLKEGESVVILGQEDAGWLKIKKGSLEGIVPESYIDM